MGMKKRKNIFNISNRLSYTLLAIFVFILGGVLVYALIPNPGHDSSELIGVCLSDGTNCNGPVQLDVVSSKTDCTIMGDIVFDSIEGKPYVCDGAAWKPLDSDFDNDGFVDWYDLDDNDNSKKHVTLTPDRILSGTNIFGVVGTFSCYDGGGAGCAVECDYDVFNILGCEPNQICYDPCCVLKMA